MQLNGKLVKIFATLELFWKVKWIQTQTKIQPLILFFASTICNCPSSLSSATAPSDCTRFYSGIGKCILLNFEQIILKILHALESICTWFEMAQWLFLIPSLKIIIQRLSFSSHHNLYIQSNTILTRIPSAITSPGETTDIHGDSTRIDSIYLRASYTIVSHCIEVIFTAEPSDLSNNAPWHIAISHITPSKGIIFSSFIIASTNHRTCQTT